MGLYWLELLCLLDSNSSQYTNTIEIHLNSQLNILILGKCIALLNEHLYQKKDN